MDEMDRKHEVFRNARGAFLKSLTGTRFIDPAVRLSSLLIAVTLVSYGDTRSSWLALGIQTLAALSVVLCSFRPLLGMILAVSALLLELTWALDIGVHIAASACIAISLTYLRWKVAAVGAAFIALSVVWKLFSTSISLAALVQVEGYVLVLALLLGASAGLGQQRLDAALIRAEQAGREAERERNKERTGIARDIHDLISFNLTRETLILNSLHAHTAATTEENLAELRLANRATHRSLRQLTRSLAGPATLGKIALVSDLREICDDVENTFNGLSSPLTISCNMRSRFCSVQAFRHLECIITEVSSNILRHHDRNRERTPSIDISFDELKGELVIQTSNARDPASANSAPHSLVSRVDELGGTHSVQLSSTFRLDARIPGELQPLDHYFGNQLADIRDLTDAVPSDSVFRFRHEDSAFTLPRRSRFDCDGGGTKSR